MDILNQIQLTLDEINALFENIKKQPEQAKSIEIDLLNYKIVQLYDQTRKLEESQLSKVKEQQEVRLLDKEDVKAEDIEVPTVVEKVIEETPSEKIEEPISQEIIESPIEPEQPTENEVVPEIEQEVKEEPVVEEIIPEEIAVVEEETVEPEPEPIVENKEEKEIKYEFKPDLFADAQEQIEKKAVHEKFAKKEHSVNERVASSKSKSSIGESLQKGKISDIKSSISLNMKLSFIKDLFLGDQKDYKKMIDFLSKCTNYSEAKMYLVNEKENREHWENKPELFNSLMDLINRRFRLD